MQPAPGSAGSGVGARLRGYAADALGILQTRLELLATEVAEERLRLGTFLGYAATAFFFLGFGALMLALFFTVLLWDSHRLLALGIFTALFLTIGIVAGPGCRALQPAGVAPVYRQHFRAGAGSRHDPAGQ